jgi:hypothetical protein
VVAVFRQQLVGDAGIVIGIPTKEDRLRRQPCWVIIWIAFVTR